MTTECNGKPFECQPLGKREVRAGFDGGTMTSDGGGVLLRKVEKRTGIVERFAGCFSDHRQAERIEHRVRELVAQRLYGLALGYEDLNDHDELRQDPLLAEKEDARGKSRVRERDQGKALAGKSTLNRLELTGAEGRRQGTLQEDRDQSSDGRPAAGGDIPGVSCGSSGGDGQAAFCV